MFVDGENTYLGSWAWYKVRTYSEPLTLETTLKTFPKRMEMHSICTGYFATRLSGRLQRGVSIR